MYPIYQNSQNCELVIAGGPEATVARTRREVRRQTDEPATGNAGCSWLDLFPGYIYMYIYIYIYIYI